MLSYIICGFCFINNFGGSWLTSTRAVRQFQDYCHTGVSVQRRDRCTGMQQGAQLLLIYNCLVYRVSMPDPYLSRPLKQLVATFMCSRCEC